MTPEQKLLLENLLDRLDADAASDRPWFRRIVSDKEREALRSLLEGSGIGIPPPKPPGGPVKPPIREEDPDPPEPDLELNKEALNYEESPAPQWTLCLDFGTAKSKAFAATDAEEDPELLPLPIGKADNDMDGSVHEVSSSIWIDDDGLLFMGSEAVKRGINYGIDHEDSTRRRLDSVKQEISQLHLESDHTQLKQKLLKEVDPTSTLTFSDAIIIYLAYLTDLSTTELEHAPRVDTRYVRRRFTLPWWNNEQRRWAGEFLSKGLMRAQLLADTFHGKWRSGIHVHQIKRMLHEAAKHDEKLAWMVLKEPPGGVLEALAAASARIWNDRIARNMMLVVDVGAGTTDISLFWVVRRTVRTRQRVQSSKDLEPLHRAWLIQPCGSAIKQAGDTLDSLLVAELMRRADLGADVALQRRVRDGLYRKSVRRLKERLFNAGEISEVLVSDHDVKLTKQEFMNLEGVKRFEQTICNEIRKLLVGIHESWNQVTKYGITLVLTGGGSSLPMIRNLADKRWKIGNRAIGCQLAADVPDGFAETLSSEFIQEYPRLGVAMGGALNMLLDERHILVEFPGKTQLEYRATNGSSFT